MLHFAISTPHGPVPQFCLQQVPPGSLIFLEALGGIPGAERDQWPLLKHKEVIRQETLKISHFS